jgi:hypothetical protein
MYNKGQFIFNVMKNNIDRLIQWYKKLPEKKNHVEFITAVLSVPVMLTVIILNLNNLNNANKKQAAEEKTTPIQVIITGEKQNTPTNIPYTSSDTPTNAPSPTLASCIKEVGPVTILFPRENEVVVKDPVCITIATQSGYCSILWSYRFDENNWSDFTDKNICLRNMTNGSKTMQLKMKSAVSNDEVILQRSFTYQGNSEPTATPPVATSSAGL